MRSPGLLILYFSLILPLFSAGQKTIRGVVRDSHSEEPVPFASVIFSGSGAGSLTDSTGSFSLRYENWPSDSLIITCVGYQP